MVLPQSAGHAASFVWLTMHRINGSSLLPSIGGRANKHECERVYSDLSEFVAFTEEWGGGARGGDTTQCTAVPCVSKSGARKESTHSYGKKTKQKGQGSSRRGLRRLPREERRKKKASLW